RDRQRLRTRRGLRTAGPRPRPSRGPAARAVDLGSLPQRARGGRRRRPGRARGARPRGPLPEPARRGRRGRRLGRRGDTDGAGGAPGGDPPRVRGARRRRGPAGAARGAAHRSVTVTRLVVVGDLLLDRDVVGTVTRLCPDAPVPVLDEERTLERPG